jgi:hypothetical protein
MIKLFIFESVDDAHAFERKEAAARPSTAVEEHTEDEPEAPAARTPVRHYKKRKGAMKPQPRKAAKGKRRSKYDADQIAKLAARVEAGEMTNQEAADEMGVSKPNWSYLKNAYGGDGKTRKAGAVARVPEGEADEKPVLSCHICEEDHMTRDCPDFGAKLAEMRESGMDSLQIAGKLKIRLKDIPVE